MVLLSVQNVSKSFVMDRVLQDVSLTLNVGDRLGLVGVNGSGKSTLLRIIAGQMEPDEGTVSLIKGTRIGFLTQKADITEAGNVFEEVSRMFDPLMRLEERMRALEDEMAATGGDEAAYRRSAAEYARLTERYEREGGYAWRSRVQGVLLGLGFARDRWDQPARLLSGGEKTRLCLARILLLQPEFLMLDEPTNHLDLDSVQWLEDTLRAYKGTIIVISHDRYFLNAVCNGMAELSMTRLTQYEGNYDAFAAQREERLTRQLKEYKMQQAEIARHKEIIARYTMFHREKSMIAARSWEKKLSRIEENRIERPTDEKTVRFSFTTRRRTGDDVLIVKDVAKGFGDRTLFDNFSLHVRAGDRVALIGPNGVGKTTLLNVITGRLKPDRGTVVFGANVDLGYYDQQQEHLHPEKTVMAEVWDNFPRMEPDEVRNTLALFLITGDEVFKPIAALSGGEKGRVALSELMLRRDNLLLLDEPTNHLDMDSREVLEHALDHFPGTILTVSHDRYFINRVCDRVVEMRADGTTEYLGNYDDYIEKKRRMTAPEDVDPYGGLTRTELEKRKRREKERKQSEEMRAARVKALEARIADAEVDLAKLEAALADPATYADPARSKEAVAAHSAAKEALDALYDEWASYDG